MTLDLAKYGITDVKEVVHNPSYEQLHKMMSGYFIRE